VRVQTNLPPPPSNLTLIPMVDFTPPSPMLLAKLRLWMYFLNGMHIATLLAPLESPHFTVYGTVRRRHNPHSIHELHSLDSNHSMEFSEDTLHGRTTTPNNGKHSVDVHRSKRRTLAKCCVCVSHDAEVCSNSGANIKI
jgi:hypothetical protein